MSNHSSLSKPPSGVGIGLRSAHVTEILQSEPDVPWFELLANNWLAEGGLTLDYVLAISERYPLTLHGVGLSLGGVEPLDMGYLNRIKKLKKRTKAAWYSEHLCFSRAAEYQFHDLCPLPYREDTLQHLVRRIQQVQEFLGEQLLVENVSSYLTYEDSEFSEAEFLSILAEEADCGLLVDLNNFYVNQVNHGDDAVAAIEKLPAHRISEIHLAGFQSKAGFLLDAHNNPVAEPVWALYRYALSRWGDIPTLIEWDHNIPPWPVLKAEQEKAARHLCKPDLAVVI